MNRIAIVGNGRSAARYAKDIDGMEFVVRINNWHTKCGERCGSKIDALVVHRPLLCDEFSDEERRRIDLELWCNIAVDELLFVPTGRRPGDARFILSLADGKAIRFIRNDVMIGVNRRLSELAGRGVCSTAGLMAVSMARDMRRWDECHIFGFDATGSAISYPAERACLVANIHDMHSEKVYLQELCADGGVVWHGKPEIDL